MRAFYENHLYPSQIPLRISRPENLGFLAHWHMDVELLYVCSGSIRAGVNKESRVLYPGELALCSSGDIHYYDSKGMQSTVILVLFRPELVGGIPGWPGNISFVTPFIDHALWREIDGGFAARGRIVELLHGLEREMDEQHKFYDLFVKSQLTELCALALRHFPSRPFDPRQELDYTPARPQSLRIMQEVLRYLDGHYMDNLSLDAVARQFNLSPCHFSRLFNQVSGMNFRAFLNSIRIAQARKLIAASDRPLTDIAFECGFNSVRTFNRAFQSIQGYAPSQLR